MKDKKALKNSEAKLFGLDEESSLISVNFATSENALLNDLVLEEKREDDRLWESRD